MSTSRPKLYRYWPIYVALLIMMSSLANADKALATEGNPPKLQFSAGVEVLLIVPYPYIDARWNLRQQNLSLRAKVGSILAVNRATIEVATNKLFSQQNTIYLNYGVWSVASLTPYTGYQTELGIEIPFRSTRYFRIGIAYDPKANKQLLPAFGLGWVF